MVSTEPHRSPTGSTEPQKKPHISHTSDTSDIPSELHTSDNSTSDNGCSNQQFKVTTTSARLISDPVTPSSSNSSTVRGRSDNKLLPNTIHQSVTRGEVGYEAHNAEVEVQEVEVQGDTVQEENTHGLSQLDITRLNFTRLLEKRNISDLYERRSSCASQYVQLMLSASSERINRDLDNTSSSNGNRASLASDSDTIVDCFVSSRTGRYISSHALPTDDFDSSSSTSSYSSYDSQSTSSYSSYDRRSTSSYSSSQSSSSDSSSQSSYSDDYCYVDDHGIRRHRYAGCCRIRYRDQVNDHVTHDRPRGGDTSYNTGSSRVCMRNNTDARRDARDSRVGNPDVRENIHGGNNVLMQRYQPRDVDMSAPSGQSSNVTRLPPVSCFMPMSTERDNRAFTATTTTASATHAIGTSATGASMSMGAGMGTGAGMTMVDGMGTGSGTGMSTVTGAGFYYHRGHVMKGDISGLPVNNAVDFGAAPAAEVNRPEDDVMDENC